MFPFSLILVGVGLYCINYSFPDIDYWDEGCETREQGESILKRYKDYVEFCSNFNEKPNWGGLDLYHPACTDAIMEPYLFFPERLEADVMEWDMPEWPLLLRNKKLNELADVLTDLALINQNQIRELLVDKPLSYKFNLGAFMSNLLLIDKAREGNGLCEFFFSFAFLAPRSIKARLKYGEGITELG